MNIFSFWNVEVRQIKHLFSITRCVRVCLWLCVVSFSPCNAVMQAHSNMSVHSIQKNAFNNIYVYFLALKCIKDGVKQASMYIFIQAFHTWNKCIWMYKWDAIYKTYEIKNDNDENTKQVVNFLTMSKWDSELCTLKTNEQNANLILLVNFPNKAISAFYCDDRNRIICIFYGPDGNNLVTINKIG